MSQYVVVDAVNVAFEVASAYRANVSPNVPHVSRRSRRCMVTIFTVLIHLATASSSSSSSLSYRVATVGSTLSLVRALSVLFLAAGSTPKIDMIHISRGYV